MPMSQICYVLAAIHGNNSPTVSMRNPFYFQIPTTDDISNLKIIFPWELGVLTALLARRAHTAVRLTYQDLQHAKFQQSHWAEL